MARIPTQSIRNSFAMQEVAVVIEPTDDGPFDMPAFDMVYTFRVMVGRRIVRQYGGARKALQSRAFLIVLAFFLVSFGLVDVTSISGTTNSSATIIHVGAVIVFYDFTDLIIPIVLSLTMVWMSMQSQLPK